MQLDDICVSLELAQQLKEAGYEQDSLFWWNFYSPGAMDEELVRTAYGRYKLENIGQDSEESISAPTASELLEQLPQGIFVAKGIKYRVWNSNTNEFTWLESDELDPIDNESLANALAKIYLNLKQNSYPL